ncbi:MAG: TM0996/MTH895 family glutaredoxin-like protein [Paludibacteraceae bacterium]|nr:TM0996/MTH895 family glutaredoxin-like protein [Paludibacteraceae bacterium]MBN2787491.1 TM0996/MTH895 family glutaredoxin-like protein [Paludibacteraceae bacterium]
MEIKVLGTGCPKCKTLEQNIREAVEKLGINATIIKVDDIMEIMNFGIMTTPALVIDGKVALKGKVASVQELTSLLTLNNK